MMGAMQLMYNLSLIGIVTMNPTLYNEYIIITIYKKGKNNPNANNNLYLIPNPSPIHNTIPNLGLTLVLPEPYSLNVHYPNPYTKFNQNTNSNPDITKKLTLSLGLALNIAVVLDLKITLALNLTINLILVLVLP
jgi:hypothetical protein